MLWDIFCDIIDNHGDLGVTWRLAQSLAQRGESVRLWLRGDASALGWMAPPGQRSGVHPPVQVMAWDDVPAQVALGAAVPSVLIEAFGCEPPALWLQHCAQSQATFPLWLNLEYLSAEPYVERCHGLASPVMSGPAQGQEKWFFYPGFTPKTGGLLHRLNPLPPAQTSADSPAVITLFCYEPPALPAYLDFLHQGGMGAGATLRIAPGRAAQAVRQTPSRQASLLTLEFLPPCAQTEFDFGLTQSDLNFVRGEDSLVSAIFANRPFIWQIYPQADGAHAAKLAAFLDWLQAPASLRLAHLWWNGLSPNAPTPADLQAWFAPTERLAWGAAVTKARARCLQQTELTDQLLAFYAHQTGKSTLKS